MKTNEFGHSNSFELATSRCVGLPEKSCHYLLILMPFLSVWLYSARSSEALNVNLNSSFIENPSLSFLFNNERVSKCTFRENWHVFMCVSWLKCINAHLLHASMWLQNDIRQWSETSSVHLSKLYRTQVQKSRSVISFGRSPVLNSSIN